VEYSGHAADVGEVVGSVGAGLAVGNVVEVGGSVVEGQVLGHWKVDQGYDVAREEVQGAGQKAIVEGVLVGNILEVVGQLARLATLAAGMIQNQEKHWRQEVLMALAAGLNREYHWAVQLAR
jgi:hypothetical protein